MQTITRREFNGAALAAMLLPAARLSLPEAAPATVDWSLFCDTYCGEFSRFDLTKPFVKAGVKFASDSRILVWQACDEPDTKVEEKRFPNAHYIVEEAMPDDPEWKPWPEPVYAFDTNKYNQHCHRCCAGFADEIPCECQSGDEWTDIGCEKCKYTCYVGTVPCLICGGKPQGPVKTVIWIGGEKVARQYDEKVRTLPGPIEYCMCDPSYEQEAALRYQTGGPILFRWSQGMGAVMPLARS